MKDEPSRKKRSFSDGHFFKKLKMMSRKKHPVMERSKTTRTRKESTNSAAKSSLSLRRANNGRNAIAKRRVLTDIGSTNEGVIGNSASNSPDKDSHNPHFSDSIPPLPLELPDIVSIRSSRSHISNKSNKSSKSSKNKHGIDLTFMPRRSLQNSKAGLKKLNTSPQGYFNIPVTIDRASENIKHADTKITFNSSSSENERPVLSILQKDDTQNSSNPTVDATSAPHNISNNNNIENSTNSLFDTILSIAHSAISHVPKISALNTEIQRELSHSSENHTGSIRHSYSNHHHGHHKHPLAQQQRNLLVSENTNQNANDTVLIHSPSTNTAHRSSSFLRRLDYLLSPNPAPSSDKHVQGEEEEDEEESSPLSKVFLSPSTQLLTTNTSTTLLSDSLTPNDKNINANSNYENENDNDRDDRSIAGKVKFQPLKVHEPAISTFGKGNLTLEAVAGSSDIDNTSIDLDENNTNNNSNVPNASLTNLSHLSKNNMCINHGSKDCLLYTSRCV